MTFHELVNLCIKDTNEEFMRQGIDITTSEACKASPPGTYERVGDYFKRHMGELKRRYHYT